MFFVLRSCDVSRSMAGWESRPDSTRRGAVASSGGSSSSLRVQEGFHVDHAGKPAARRSCGPSLSSALPVLSELTKMTVSPVDPVSTITVAMMVSDPPSSIGPRKREDDQRLESTPPDRISPTGDALL